MGSQSVCHMSHGLSSDEGDMAPCGVLEGVSRGKLHPRLGGGAGGVVVVQRGERDVAADALSGNLSRARSSEEMVRGPGFTIPVRKKFRSPAINTKFRKYRFKFK